MGRVVVISQSMYFPWCGLLDQLRRADVFVHYDDVQLSRGFYYRVQAKTPQGIMWLTVPLHDRHRGQLIDESRISYAENWIERHRGILRTSYARAPFVDEALRVFESVFAEGRETLGELARASIRACAGYFGVDRDVEFLESRELGIGGTSSQRLLNITRHLGGSVYLTGHGALNYLNHDLFEQQGVEVRYMKYQILEYPQLHGLFTPYVTSLDAIAHLGLACAQVLQSETVGWRDAVAGAVRLRNPPA